MTNDYPATFLKEDPFEYAHELYLERKAKEGWHQCEGCGDWLHDEDYMEGSGFCKCDTEREDEE
jgi:hypothetical protein